VDLPTLGRPRITISGNFGIGNSIAAAAPFGLKASVLFLPMSVQLGFPV
jgi:hypothetical protein